jgi:hypothetical protein
MAKKDSAHETKEGSGMVGTIRTLEDALRHHHLATADPEPERDGLLTGPAHEAKYGLERAEGSAQTWRDSGVHPIANRALVGDEEGSENLRGNDEPEGNAAAIETAVSPNAPENAAAPRASS